MSSEGTASLPFNETQARKVIERIKAGSFQAVAVCFLWSIANPDHEIRFSKLLEEIVPEIPYTLSHRLIPIVREYRRASATAIDASLKPIMQRHLRDLEKDLRDAGFRGELLISTTAGGCNYTDALVEKPIYTVGSGPAMAPIAGLTFSRTRATRRQCHYLRHWRHDLRCRPCPRWQAHLYAGYLARSPVHRRSNGNICGGCAFHRRGRRLDSMDR